MIEYLFRLADKLMEITTTMKGQVQVEYKPPSRVCNPDDIYSQHIDETKQPHHNLNSSFSPTSANHKQLNRLLSGKVLACLFMEPSVQTSCGFMAAMLKLGGGALLISGEVMSKQINFFIFAYVYMVLNVVG
jgi:ornithine carbamoyltransferase